MKEAIIREREGVSTRVSDLLKKNSVAGSRGRCDRFSGQALLCMHLPAYLVVAGRECMM